MSGKVHGGKGKSGAKDGGIRSQSHSARAGLQFPVGRVKRFLKRNAQNKIRVGAKGKYFLLKCGGGASAFSIPSLLLTD